MNVNKFLALLKEHGDRQEDLANFLGISRPCASAKIHSRGGSAFTQPEISAMKQRYNLSSEQIDAIFFADDVS